MMKYLHIFIAAIGLSLFAGDTVKSHASGIFQLTDADRTLTAIALRLQNLIQLTPKQRTTLKAALHAMNNDLPADSLNRLDHEAVLSVLDNRQFRLVIASRYAETIDSEVATLWTELFKANRTKDLNPQQSGITIRNYFIDMYSVEEIYWNDPVSRQAEQHRIKAYAPIEIRRYHQLQLKKNSPKHRYRW